MSQHRVTDSTIIVALADIILANRRERSGMLAITPRLTKAVSDDGHQGSNPVTVEGNARAQASPTG